MIETIKLQKDAILQVPLNIYNNDFTFIVNNIKYQTNKFVADLISPKISKLHQMDPTLNEFLITTTNKDDFNLILNLIKFEEETIKSKDIQFFMEILEKLGTEHISFNIKEEEIRIDNIISLIQKQEKYQYFYSTIFEKEIDFFSSRFHEILVQQKEEVKKLSLNSLEQIINNSKLKVDTEDELLSFINELYIENQEYSTLYEYVYFINVSVEKITDFLRTFDINYLTSNTWKSISLRLVQKIDENSTPKSNNETINFHHHYKSKKVKKQKVFKDILYIEGHLEGIFNEFQKNSNIKDEVSVTFSSHVGSGTVENLLQIQNTTNDFYTADNPGSWICFEFKKHQINPTNYSIRSFNASENKEHPKSWIIEGSQDNKQWTKLDEQKNNSSLNGANIVHTFPIKERKGKENEQSFKYLRMRLTGPNWYDNDDTNHRLDICSIEFYGQLI